MSWKRRIYIGSDTQPPVGTWSGESCFEPRVRESCSRYCVRESGSTAVADTPSRRLRIWAAGSDGFFRWVFDSWSLPLLLDQNTNVKIVSSFSKWLSAGVFLLKKKNGYDERKIFQSRMHNFLKTHCICFIKE